VFDPLTAMNPSSNSTFTGDFMITDLHHYGNYRSPSEDGWVTVANMVALPLTEGG
jgi:hypothetical protein